MTWHYYTCPTCQTINVPATSSPVPSAVYQVHYLHKHTLCFGTVLCYSRSGVPTSCLSQVCGCAHGAEPTLLLWLSTFLNFVGARGQELYWQRHFSRVPSNSRNSRRHNPHTHSPQFYARCPSCCNPPILPGLGTWHEVFAG